jgi:alkaline phosphatase D
MSGDVDAFGRATLWAHADRPCRVRFELGDGAARIAHEAEASWETGGTARVALSNLPRGSKLVWRATPIGDRPGDPLTARLSTPGEAPRFVFGGDVCGQGFGIDPTRGGLQIFDAMRAREPDFLLHSGDAVYADGPLEPELALEDGSMWRNLVTPEKRKVAESLDEFRGQYRYNLLDPAYRRFFAEVPLIAQWDDHETTNNWVPGEPLDDSRYTEHRVDALAARARRAFVEFMPSQAGPGDRLYRRVACGPHLDVFVLDLRSHRGPNDPEEGRGAEMLGAEQLEGLIAGLQRSRATFKLVASSVPLGLVIGDGPDRFEGFADGTREIRGRERELATLLTRIRRVGGVVFVAADVHYAAAHRFDPARAAFRDFAPFWEFVAGPLHAGTFGPGELDPTFGPRVEFSGIPVGMAPNRPPSEGLQFFGAGEVLPREGVLRISLHDATGRELYRHDVRPDAPA